MSSTFSSFLRALQNEIQEQPLTSRNIFDYAVKPLDFVDPQQNLVHPSNATTPLPSLCSTSSGDTWWPVVTLEERSSFARTVQSVATALTHLASSSSSSSNNNTDSNKKNNNPSISSLLPPLATPSDCSRWCLLNNNNINNSIVSIKICSSSNEMIAFKNRVRNSTAVTNFITLPFASNDDSVESNSSSMFLCQTMKKIQDFFLHSTTNDTKKTLLVDVFILPSLCASHNEIDLLQSVFLSQIYQGIQREFHKILSSNGEQNNTNFEVIFLIGDIASSSSSSRNNNKEIISFVTTVVNYFEQLVITVPILEQDKENNNHHDDEAEEDQKMIDEDTSASISDFEEAIVNQISTWHAAKQLSSLQDEDAEQQNANEVIHDDKAVLVVPSMIIAKNVMKKIQEGYDTSNVNVGIFSRFGKFMFSNSSASSIEQDLRYISVVIVVAKNNSTNFQDFIELMEIINSTKNNTKIMKISLLVYDPLSFSTKFFEPSNVKDSITTKDATIARIKLVSATSENSSFHRDQNKNENAFWIVGIAEFLLKTFRCTSRSNNNINNHNHFVVLPSQILHQFSASVKFLLLSGAVSILDPSTNERSKIFSCFTSHDGSSGNNNNNTRSSLLAESLENANRNEGNNNNTATPQYFKFLLTPLGRFAVQFCHLGFGILESKVLVAAASLSLCKNNTSIKIDEIIAQIWAKRFFCQNHENDHDGSEQQSMLSPSIANNLFKEHLQQQKQQRRNNENRNSSGSISQLLSSLFGENPSSSSLRTKHDNTEQQNAHETSLLHLVFSYSSYPLFVKSDQPLLSFLFHPNSSAAASPSLRLIHTMISCPLSTRVPLSIDVLEEMKYERDSSSSSSSSSSSHCWNQASCKALLATTPGNTQNQRQNLVPAPALSGRRIRPRNIGGGASGGSIVTLIDVSAESQQQKQQLQEEQLRLQQMSAFFNFPLLSAASDPWCAVVPDTLTVLGTNNGQWLCLPADCSNALIALKSCLRTFMDNAMHLFVESISEDNKSSISFSLPQLPAIFLNHEAVRKILASSNSTSVADSTSTTTTTTIGFWIQQQLRRSKLQKPSSNSAKNVQNNNNDNENTKQQQILDIIHNSCSTALTTSINNNLNSTIRPHQQQQQQWNQNNDNNNNNNNQEDDFGPKIPQNSANISQQQVVPTLSYAPFVGQLPPKETRDLIDKLAPKILSQGLEKAKGKLKGNPATAFADDNHAFYRYFVWAISTFNQRTGGTAE